MRLAEQRNDVGVLHFFAGIHDQYTVCDLRNHTEVGVMMTTAISNSFCHFVP